MNNKYGKIIKVNLVIDAKNINYDFTAIKKIEGCLIIKMGYNVVLPNLDSVEDDIIISDDSTLETPSLTNVQGHIKIGTSTTFNAPRLETVKRFIKINKDSIINMQSLRTAGGSIAVASDMTFPKLQTTKHDILIKGCHVSLPNLEVANNDVYIDDYSHFDAPKLQRVIGNFTIYDSTIIDTPMLHAITGQLSVFNDAVLPALQTVGESLYVSATLTVPQLKSIGTSCHICNGSKLKAPLLETVGYHLFVNERTVLRNLQSVGNDIRVHDNVHIYVPNLQHVRGCVFVEERTVFKANILKVIGGSLRIRGRAIVNTPELKAICSAVQMTELARLEAPKLEIVGKHLILSDSLSLPSLRAVGNDISLNFSSKLEAPLLETVGEHLVTNDSAKLEAPNLNKTETGYDTVSKLLFAMLLPLGYVYADDMLFLYVSKHGSIYKIRSLDRHIISYVAQQDSYFAHGRTIKLAYSDLLYKMARNRGAEQYQNLDLEIPQTVEFWSTCYRVITGACAYGVECFLETISDIVNAAKKETYKFEEVVEHTKGQYGNEMFRDFFKC